MTIEFWPRRLLRPSGSLPAKKPKPRTLSAEFDEVQIDLTNKCVAVETLPIVLQDIDLGPFRVVLEWTKLRHDRPYQVIALEPNPAAGKSDETHPHVRDDELCEGDGQPSIRQALHQGRILDFFLLVRQILENYNPQQRLRETGRVGGTRVQRLRRDDP
jgi:hypothetical protein